MRAPQLLVGDPLDALARPLRLERTKTPREWAEGEKIEKAQGRDAANATLVKAKDLYHKAVETVSDWTDGDLGGKSEATL